MSVDKIPNTILRQQRMKRMLSAGFLEGSSFDTTSEEPLNWQMLLDVPEWCHWSPTRIERLALVAGSVFTAPAVRLWIESTRVEEVQTIIGMELFQQIMSLEEMPNAVLDFPNDVNLRDSLLAAGASVLLCSIPHQCLRERMAYLVSEPSGVLPIVVAETLMQESLSLIESNDQVEEMV